MNTDKNCRGKVVEPMPDQSLIGASFFAALKWFRIRVHLCPSVLRFSTVSFQIQAVDDFVSAR